MLVYVAVCGAKFAGFVVCSDSAGACVDLSGDEEGQNGGDDDSVKRYFSTDLEVLVASEGCSAEVVDIVLEEDSGECGFSEGVDDDSFDGFIVSDEFKEFSTFGCSVFEVSHIDVESSAVEEESAVAGGFSPISVVYITYTEVKGVKDVVSDACGDSFGCAADAFGIGHASEFSFDSEDPFFHGVCPSQRLWECCFDFWCDKHSEFAGVVLADFEYAGFDFAFITCGVDDLVDLVCL